MRRERREPSGPDDPNRSRTRILLVEDENDHAELIRRAFERSIKDFDLIVVDSMSAAKQAIAQSTPDVVIADLRLPDGDGTELVSADREQTAFPVVVMTSHGDERVAVEAMRTGAIDYVVKSTETFSQMPLVAERALRAFELILERRRAEGALRQREEHFRSLIENALDLIGIVREDGLVLYLSPACRRMLGYEPRELIGTSLGSLVPEEERLELEAFLREVVNEPGVPMSIVFRVRSADGSWRVLETVGSARPGDGAVRSAIVNSRDITERKEAEESKRRLEARLRQAQKLETLGTLAGGIAHDFNNILQAIQGCAELAQNSDAGEKATRYLSRLLEATDRAGRLVRQILTFSRKGERDLQPILIGPVVLEVARLMRMSLPPGVEIRSEVRSETRVLADSTQIHQIIMNLCTNAQHAMEELGGILDLMVEGLDVGSLESANIGIPAGRYVRLRVRDTGRGMTEEIKDRVFEPFFTTKSTGKGTGLGLSVVHGIVTSCGGTIQVESQAGEGTVFDVYLPEATGTEKDLSLQVPPRSPRPKSGALLLGIQGTMGGARGAG